MGVCALAVLDGERVLYVCCTAVRTCVVLCVSEGFPRNPGFHGEGDMGFLYFPLFCALELDRSSVSHGLSLGGVPRQGLQASPRSIFARFPTRLRFARPIAAQEIIGPLLAALPENDKRKTLQSVYTKAQKARDGGSAGDGGQEGGGGFNFFGFGAKPSAQPAKPIPAATPVSGRSKGGSAASGPAAGDPYAFAAAKLSAADYQLFKTRTQLFARGGINAR